jgi:hypothetical protein
MRWLALIAIFLAPADTFEQHRTAVESANRQF